MCEYIMQRGADVHAHNDDGLTPLGQCLSAYTPSFDDAAAARMCDTMHSLLRDTGDVRDMLQTCGLSIHYATGEAVQPSAAVSRRTASSPARLRAMMHTFAVVRAYPATLLSLLHAATGYQLRYIASMTLLRTARLDTHPSPVPDVYIPDPYRVTGDVHAAVCFAAGVDTLVDAQQHAGTMGHDTWATLTIWGRHVRSFRSPGESDTLRTWAWMRRIQAVAGRVRTLSGGTAREARSNKA